MSGGSWVAGRPVGCGRPMISGAKLDGFRGWKVGKLGGMLDPLETKQIHGSKSTKLPHTNKSQKKLGLFLVGIFEIGEEQNKIRLENTMGRLRNRDQRGSRYQDDVGRNPMVTIFHVWSGSYGES